MSRGGGYIGPACKISPKGRAGSFAADNFCGLWIHDTSDFSPGYYLPPLLSSATFSTPRFNLSPVHVREFFFFLSFLSLERGSKDSSRFVEMIAEAIIIEEFEYAFNAYPFIKVKQHLRKLDRFRIRPSGSRIIVLLPGN